MVVRSIKLAGLLPTLIALMAVGLSARCASAMLSGEADFGYVRYQSETPTPSRLDAQSFIQRYALVYSTASRLGGNNGYYKLSLGYEWAAINAKVTSTAGDDDIATSAGHLLYRGELLVNPTTLPFRLMAFSRDTSRISYYNDSVQSLTNLTSIVAPALPTTIINNKSYSSGINLLLGAKEQADNKINTAFYHLPTIMFDYRDDVQRGGGQFPMDSRQRRTALVFNRNYNWLHFRTSNSEDFLNPSANTHERLIILGNIDRRMDRQWIDLTNWIKISADGQYLDQNDAINGARNQFSVHLFSTLAREKWEASAFNSYQRSVDTVTGLTYETNTPLYVRGTWNSETDWQSRIVYDEIKEIHLDDTRLVKTDLFSSLRVNSFKHSKFNLSSMLSIGKYTQNESGTYIAEASVESASTRRFSDRLGLAAGYDIKAFQYSGSTASDYLLQTLTGRVTSRLADSVRGELQERLIYTSGKESSTLPVTSASSQSSFSNNFSTGSSIYQTPEQNSTAAYLRSQTDLKLKWNVAARIDTSAIVSEDLAFMENGEKQSTTTFVHQASVFDTHYSLVSDVVYTLKTTAVATDTELGLRGQYLYTPDKSVTASLRYFFSRSTFSGQVYNNHEAEQRLQYTYFGRWGDRKLLEFFESLKYLDQNSARTRSLQVSATWWPLRNLYLAAGGKYTLIDPVISRELSGSGSIGVVYTKLQASLDYSYGKREGTDYRIDKRFSANMKKLF